jgi:hypothetical protein
MTSQLRILGDFDIFLALSRLAINPHSKQARLRLQTNPATVELLKATIQFNEQLKHFRDDYDLFCTNLASLGGFEEPHTVDGISADWILAYQLLVNDLVTLQILYGVLMMMPANTKVELPLSPQLVNLYQNGTN